MKNQTSKTIRSFQTSVNAIINRIAFASFITLFLLNGLVSAQSAQVVPSLSLVDQTNSASASGEVLVHAPMRLHGYRPDNGT